uniref:Uncharacterized protein n=1 Tax=Timema shepardi TaxID=629360 RepID=A0A7R9FWG6_TIMSH|nr:unnamed protein product [Timema shepardi]
MAEIVSISAGLVILLGIVLNFSLHKLEEGHVGVYYRVSLEELVDEEGNGFGYQKSRYQRTALGTRVLPLQGRLHDGRELEKE